MVKPWQRRATACLAQNVLEEAVCLDQGLPCCEAAVAEPQDMWPLQHFEMISIIFRNVFLTRGIGWTLSIVFLLDIRAIFWEMFRDLVNVRQSLPITFWCPSLRCAYIILHPQIPSPTGLKMIGSLPHRNMNSGPVEGWGLKQSHNLGAHIDSQRF